MDKSINNKQWCVYVLKCRDNSLYIGLTNNIDKRLKEHDRGTGSKFVRSKRPFELLKTIPCNDAKQARSLEYSLKKLKRSEKIKALSLETETA
ncbi:MAG: GIY-YIG nuclease family protein [Nitrospirota bacterium]